VAKSSFNYITLYEASSRLTAQFGLNGFKMVENAVRSAEVPVRALKDYTDAIPVRIENKITSGMSIVIGYPLTGHSSVIRDRFGRIIWRDVEVDWTKCLDYCKANLVPSSSIAQRQTSSRGRPAKIGGAVRDMTLAINKNKISLEKLAAMKGKELAQKFGVGRTTATEARKVVLKEADSLKETDGESTEN
jgi:hypothetical protein